MKNLNFVRDLIHRYHDTHKPFPRNLVSEDVFSKVGEAAGSGFENFNINRSIFLDACRSREDASIRFGDYQIHELEPEDFMMVGWFSIANGTVYTQEDKKIFLTVKVKDFKLVSLTLTMPASNKRFYYVKSGCKHVYIEEDSILYLEKVKNQDKTIWHYGKKDTLAENASLGSHMTLFPENFVQICRHIIINLNHVVSREKNFIIFSNGDRVYVANPEKVCEIINNRRPGVMPVAR